MGVVALQAVLSAILGFDDIQDLPQIELCLVQSQLPLFQLEVIFDHLVADRRYRAAAQVGGEATRRGSCHWPISLFVVLRYCRQGAWNEAFAALERFRDAIDATPATQEEGALFSEHPAVQVLILDLIMALRTEESDQHRKLILIESLKELFPQLRHILEGEPVPSNNPFKPGGLENGAKPLSFECVAADMRTERRVLLCMRENITGRGGCRTFEFPPRMEAAMRSYGWQVTFFPLHREPFPADTILDLPSIIERCKADAIDLLIWDLEMDPDPSHSLGELRQKLPNINVVAISFDPWMPDMQQNVRQLAPFADAIWSVMPALPLWNDPCFKGKLAFFPFPLGVWPSLIGSKRKPGISFIGAVDFCNWPRALWLSQVNLMGQNQVRIDLSSIVDDGLTAKDSFQAYMNRLAESYAAINFSLRSNFERTATGRIWEVLAAEGLLVQERSDDIDSYFVAGRDYLRFETFGDLRAILRFLKECPEQAEEIRLNGARRMRSIFNDVSIIGYLDAVLRPNPGHSSRHAFHQG